MVDSAMLGDARTTHLICPQCWSTPLRPLVDADRVNLRCDSCRICWHIELDHVHRVDPTGCRTCPERAECLLVAPRVHDLTPS